MFDAAFNQAMADMAEPRFRAVVDFHAAVTIILDRDRRQRGVRIKLLHIDMDGVLDPL